LEAVAPQPLLEVLARLPRIEEEFPEIRDAAPRAVEL
jgi:hypothetical protein